MAQTSSIVVATTIIEQLIRTRSAAATVGKRFDALNHSPSLTRPLTHKAFSKFTVLTLFFVYSRALSVISLSLSSCVFQSSIDKWISLLWFCWRASQHTLTSSLNSLTRAHIQASALGFAYNTHQKCIFSVSVEWFTLYALLIARCCILRNILKIGSETTECSTMR